jgi:DNA-3-methyladenine glycosylase II
MFSLGRPDIWPVGDLAVREGFKRIQGLEDRPTAAQLKPLGEPYRPYRSALAMLCWRFCMAEPL